MRRESPAAGWRWLSRYRRPGFGGVFTGQAADFFLPGILINALYGAGALISILVGWLILGLMLGGIMGDFTGWRSIRNCVGPTPPPPGSG